MKKIYIEPNIHVVEIRLQHMITTSANFNINEEAEAITSEDVVASRRSSLFDFEDED